MVASGTIESIGALATTEVTFDWPWTFDRHELELHVDTGNAIAEQEEASNQRRVFTDALAVGFYVEPTLYEYFHTLPLFAAHDGLHHRQCLLCEHHQREGRQSFYYEGSLLLHELGHARYLIDIVC